jgi:hypothetical protein
MVARSSSLVRIGGYLASVALASTILSGTKSGMTSRGSPTISSIAGTIPG